VFVESATAAAAAAAAAGRTGPTDVSLPGYIFKPTPHAADRV